MLEEEPLTLPLTTRELSQILKKHPFLRVGALAFLCLPRHLTSPSQHIFKGVHPLQRGPNTTSKVRFGRQSSQIQSYSSGLNTACLSGTQFEDDIENLTIRFDKGVKHAFKDPDEAYHIQFASRRERELALNIREGRFTIPG